MPTVFRTGAYRFFFFSNEAGEQPHIHVESGDDYAKFWILPVALARSVGYNARELHRIRELVEEHRELLEDKWHEYFDR